jgi:hypothetical protein
LAAGIAPGDYQSRPAIRESLAILRSYLATQREAQPLHNRMILLWAASKLGGILADAERSALIGEIRRAQEAGGAWTLAALGAWKERSGAPPARGGNSYATALAAYVLRQAGVARSDVALEKALDWLKAHQDPQGFWTADSMNKHYEPGSMPLLFMRDAATGYAAAALAE